MLLSQYHKCGIFQMAQGSAPVPQAKGREMGFKDKEKSGSVRNSNIVAAKVNQIVSLESDYNIGCG